MKQIIVLGVLAVCFSRANAQGADKVFKFESVKVDVVNGDVLGGWSSKIDDTIMDLDMPIKADIDEGTSFEFAVTCDGEVVAQNEGSVCGLFDDKTVMPDVLAKGIPEGEFPDSCPISAGNYGVAKYSVSSDTLKGVPVGPASATVRIFNGDGDLLKMEIAGQVAMK